MQPDETIRIEDVNGDGHNEVLRVLSNEIICQDLHGHQLWKAVDFDGNGKPRILVPTENGLMHCLGY
jgi:hypothetical protein